MTWRVGVQVDFSAAHSHTGAGEDCARLHGHNYKVEVKVAGKKLKHGMAIDFRQLRKLLKETIAAWDHRVLNEVDDFVSLLPTTENIARVFYEKLESAVPEFGVRLEEVVVWEKSDCWASYSRKMEDDG